MSFTEKIKNEVMQKAGYCCCVCQRSSVSVQVHHIIPEAEGGDDSIENAVPLCPSCHSDYGGNPEKRTRIRQMRDWRYETVAKMYSSNIASPEQLSGIHKYLRFIDVKQDSILKKQEKHDTDLENLKTQLKIISNNTIDNMTPATSDITISAVLSTAVSSVASLESGNVMCSRCKKWIDSRHDYCPYCGQFMG